MANLAGLAIKGLSCRSASGPLLTPCARSDHGAVGGLASRSGSYLPVSDASPCGIFGQLLADVVLIEPKKFLTQLTNIGNPNAVILRAEREDALVVRCNEVRSPIDGASQVDCVISISRTDSRRLRNSRPSSSNCSSGHLDRR